MLKKRFLLILLLVIPVLAISAPRWRPRYCELHGDMLLWRAAQPTSVFSRYAIRIGNEMPHANRFYVAYGDADSTEVRSSFGSKWVLFCPTCREREIGQETGEYPPPRF